MNTSELQARLVAAEAAYVAKSGRQPYIGGATLKLGHVGAWECSLWIKESRGLDRCQYMLLAKGETADEAIDAFFSAVADLPDAETAALHEFQRDLGRLIDKGRDLGIDAKWLNPITETARELAENVLTHEAAE